MRSCWAPASSCSACALAPTAPAPGVRRAAIWSSAKNRLDCARREALEEAGIELGPCRLVGVTNDLFEVERKHYVTLFYVADFVAGVPTVREPSKCAEWRWWAWDALPENLFLPLRHLREQGFALPSLLA